jgi:hypothetical protein
MVPLQLGAGRVRRVKREGEGCCESNEGGLGHLVSFLGRKRLSSVLSVYATPAASLLQLLYILGLLLWWGNNATRLVWEIIIRPHPEGSLLLLLSNVACHQ